MALAAEELGTGEDHQGSQRMRLREVGEAYVALFLEVWVSNEGHGSLDVGDLRPFVQPPAEEV